MPLRSFCALCVFVLSTILPQADACAPAYLDRRGNDIFSSRQEKYGHSRFAGHLIHFLVPALWAENLTRTRTVRSMRRRQRYSAREHSKRPWRTDYFTHVKINGKALRLTRVQSYAAMIQQTTLVMEFVAYLPEPVDPATDKLSVSVFRQYVLCGRGF